jgi:hypothetical protein
MTRGIREGPALWIDCCLGLERQHHQGQGKQNSGEDWPPVRSMQQACNWTEIRTSPLRRNVYNASSVIKGFNVSVVMARACAWLLDHHDETSSPP